MEKIEMYFIRNFLPAALSYKLWGNREKWGKHIDPTDACWKEWQNEYMSFYMSNQRDGIGTLVNDAGYKVMSEVDMAGKTILEIGPGDILHINYWNTEPKEFILADVQTNMLEKSEAKLKDRGIRTKKVLLQQGKPFPLEDASIDMIISFYSLEHIYPLRPYLEEFNRVLKDDGLLVGAIPAEGGFAWGLGRMLTSRRWFKKNTTIDPDKIICWEHPNFADEIMQDLKGAFNLEKYTYWPFSFLGHIDFNLVVKFIAKKKHN